MNGNSGEAVDLQQLAAAFLQSGGMPTNEEVSAPQEQQTESPAPVGDSGHPAWKPVLEAIPAEYHEAIIPTLKEWDTGVSRKFQKIHDTYAPFKELNNVDPDTLKQALNVYEALNNDPAATWETIGRVYGLSPQNAPQQSSGEESDYDEEELPPSLRRKLAKLEEHERVLAQITREMVEKKEAEEAAKEDQALENYLRELKNQHGEFDEDYVTNLLAIGIDGDEAVERYKNIVSSVAARYSPTPTPPAPKASTPKVMPSGGGIPTGGKLDVKSLSSKDTESLVAEILKQAADK